jgi:hypothetical protein
LELEPLLAVATSVLLPVLRADEAMVSELLAPPGKAEPLRVQVTAQEPSLGVTEKRVLVPAAAATRTLFEDGLAAVIEQAGKT